MGSPTARNREPANATGTIHRHAPARGATMLLAASVMLGGLVILTFGADRLVVAAARLSRVWGVSPILIGALIIGLGTSSPELLVSALAALKGDLSLSMANIVGSNIGNVTLVLGAGALVAPIVPRLTILRREGRLMLIAVAGLAVLLADASLERWEGALLMAAMALSVVLLIYWSSKEKADRSVANARVAELAGDPTDGRREMLVGLFALAVTLLGAQLLVEGAESFAEEAGLTTSFIGLTLLAVGTSLPELATTLAACRRGETDLVVGNLLGSNLFNALAVAGVAGLLGPGRFDTALRPLLLVMVLAAVVAGLFSVTGRRIVRSEAVALLVGFAAFIVLSAGTVA